MVSISNPLKNYTQCFVKPFPINTLGLQEIVDEVCCQYEMSIAVYVHNGIKPIEVIAHYKREPEDEELTFLFQHNKFYKATSSGYGYQGCMGYHCLFDAVGERDNKARFSNPYHVVEPLRREKFYPAENSVRLADIICETALYESDDESSTEGAFLPRFRSYFHFLTPSFPPNKSALQYVVNKARCIFPTLSIGIFVHDGKTPINIVPHSDSKKITHRTNFHFYDGKFFPATKSGFGLLGYQGCETLLHALSEYLDLSELSVVDDRGGLRDCNYLIPPSSSDFLNKIFYVPETPKQEDLKSLSTVEEACEESSVVDIRVMDSQPTTVFLSKLQNLCDEFGVPYDVEPALLNAKIIKDCRVSVNVLANQ